MAKAQIFSVDVILASAILITILISVFFYWNYSQRKLSHQEDQSYLLSSAEQAAAQLLLTSGGNWSASNSSAISSLGLAHQPWILSPSKIANFSLLPYNTSKELLGMKGQEFFMQVRQWNGTAYYTINEIGPEMNQAPEILKVTRLALLNNQWAVLELFIWVPHE